MAKCNSYRTLNGSRVYCALTSGHRGDHINGTTTDGRSTVWNRFSTTIRYRPEPDVAVNKHDEEITEMIAGRNKQELGEEILAFQTRVSKTCDLLDKERENAVEAVGRAVSAERDLDHARTALADVRKQRNKLMDAIEEHELAENDFFHHRRRAAGARGHMLNTFDEVGNQRKAEQHGENPWLR